MKQIILALLSQGSGGGGGGGGGSGTVTNVSVAAVNGFDGVVFNATTTPNINLKTTELGVLTGIAGGAMQGIPFSASAVFATNGSSVPSFTTTLPGVGSGATLVSNPFTVTTTSLNTALADIYTHASGTGTVTAVSGVNTNGFTFSIATSTTTPAITLGVSINGLVKANGTALSAITPSANAILATDGSSVMSFTTTLPAIGSGASLVTNPVTTTITALNTALSDIYAHAPGGGTVTNVSGNAANGFSFVITNPTTTPNITIKSTSVGLLKSNGAAMSAITPIGNAVLATNGSSSMSFVTVLPAVNSGDTLVHNPITLNTSGLNVALQDIAASTPGGGSGLDPYNPSKLYHEGDFIAGDGVNGLLGAVFVCLQNNTTGSFAPSLWGCTNGLDLAHLPNMNSFSGTSGLPASISGTGNSFSGFNAGTCLVMSGSNNQGSGTFALSSNGTISGQKNAVFGPFAAGSGFASSLSFNSLLGYGSGFGLTTGIANLLLSYQAGQNIDAGMGNIILGAAGGSPGAYDHNLVIANPSNGNVILEVANTNSPLAANQFLGTPNGSTGALGLRSINGGDINTPIVHWTPTISVSIPGDLSITYNQQFGSLRVIGKMAFLNYYLAAQVTYTTASGVFSILGMGSLGLSPSDEATGVGDFFVKSTSLYLAGYTSYVAYMDGSGVAIQILPQSTKPSLNPAPTGVMNITDIDSGTSFKFRGQLVFPIA